MIEKELIKIWQSSPNQEQVKFEKSRLMIDVQANVDQFHKSMKWLYLREAIGAIVVIPIFAVYAFIFPQILTKIASVLIILWGIYILRVIQKTQKQIPLEYTTSYLEYLHQTKSYLELQKKLRDNIIYWYVSPLFSFVFLFMLGFVIDEPNIITYIMQIGTFCFVCGGIIYLLNRISSKKFVEPKLKKVNELILTLEE